MNTSPVPTTANISETLTVPTTANISETLTAESKKFLNTIEAFYTELKPEDRGETTGATYVTITVLSSNLNSYIKNNCIDTIK